MIELLVVIAIIGLLATIVLSSLSAARSKARDARRLGDIHEIRTALETSYSIYGKYPNHNDGNCSYLTSFAVGGCLRALVTAGIMPVLPSDPNPSQQYYYDNFCMVYDPPVMSAHQFRLWANGENDHDGLSQNWWTDSTIGETTCLDPS